MESNLSQYLATNAECAMPKQHFWIPFWSSWHKAMMVAAIQSGLRKTGIFPVNGRMIKDSDLGPSATTDNTVNLQGKMYSEMVVYYGCVGMENQIFILITPAAINYFHQILKNCHFGVRKKSFLTHMDLYDPYMVPYTIL